MTSLKFTSFYQLLFFLRHILSHFISLLLLKFFTSLYWTTEDFSRDSLQKKKKNNNCCIDLFSRIIGVQPANLLAKDFTRSFYQETSPSTSRTAIPALHSKRVRSSPSGVFIGKAVLKLYNRFKGESTYRSAISIRLLSNFIETALRHGSSPVNLLRIFRTLFPKNTHEGMHLISHF